MKYFKCGSCQTQYKIDEQKITKSAASVVCVKCGAKNVLRFGPLLTVQSKNEVSQFSLKEGVNLIGRKSPQGEATIKVSDPYVSRKHASISVEQKEGKVFISIEDLESLNGVFNKNKVKLKRKLKYPFTTEDYYIIGLTKLTITY